MSDKVYLRAEGYNVSERGEQSLAELQQKKQSSLLEGFVKREKETKKMTCKKFEVAHVVSKGEVTFTKYLIFLALEEHGVEIITAYHSVRRAYICRLYRPKYNCCIERQSRWCKFYSVPC